MKRANFFRWPCIKAVHTHQHADTFGPCSDKHEESQSELQSQTGGMRKCQCLQWHFSHVVGPGACAVGIAKGFLKEVWVLQTNAISVRHMVFCNHCSMGRLRTPSWVVGGEGPRNTALPRFALGFGMHDKKCVVV